MINESDLEGEKCQEYKDILAGVVIGGWEQTVAGHGRHAKKKICFVQ